MYVALLEAELLLQPERIKQLARLRRLLLPKLSGPVHPDHQARRPQVLDTLLLVRAPS